MVRSTGALVNYWDRQAGAYDVRTAGVERRWLAASRRWVCARAHGDTLELAIGTGANLPHYPPDVALTGVDWSAEMLRAARRRAERTGRTVDLRRADATALPFPDDAFDTVVSTYAFCCIPDVRAALTEALRVLRPGGDLLLADHVVATSWPLRAVQHAVELFSVPLQGEHYTRRPIAVLRTLGVEIVASDRLHLGAVERVHSRTPAPPPDRLTA